MTNHPFWDTVISGTPNVSLVLRMWHSNSSLLARRGLICISHWAESGCFWAPVFKEFLQTCLWLRSMLVNWNFAWGGVDLCILVCLECNSRYFIGHALVASTRRKGQQASLPYFISSLAPCQLWNCRACWAKLTKYQNEGHKRGSPCKTIALHILSLYGGFHQWGYPKIDGL